MTKEFLVVFEVGPNNFSAFAPDIPGCFALGATIELTRERYLEAANAHLEWMASDHDTMPEPVTTAYDFARSEESEAGHYVVEWLAIPIPAEAPRSLTAA
jgi:predicted RNase H-like HicB family nuclease